MVIPGCEGDNVVALKTQGLLVTSVGTVDGQSDIGRKTRDIEVDKNRKRRKRIVSGCQAELFAQRTRLLENIEVELTIKDNSLGYYSPYSLTCPFSLTISFSLCVSLLYSGSPFLTHLLMRSVVLSPCIRVRDWIMICAVLI